MCKFLHISRPILKLLSVSYQLEPEKNVMKGDCKTPYYFRQLIRHGRHWSGTILKNIKKKLRKTGEPARTLHRLTDSMAQESV